LFAATNKVVVINEVQAATNASTHASTKSVTLNNAQPPVIAVEKGKVLAAIVDGEDITEDCNRLLTYGIDWKSKGYGKAGERWTNFLFQADPWKGKYKRCLAVFLFADGTKKQFTWGEDRLSIPRFSNPFQVVHARYGFLPRAVDVTRNFQLWLHVMLDSSAIKAEKNPEKRTRLEALWKKITESKDFRIQRQGYEDAPTVKTFKELQAGWGIETSASCPRFKKASSTRQKPGFVVGRYDERTILYAETWGYDEKKEKEELALLPKALQVIVNENKLLEAEDKSTKAGKK
jgi:hypothetical protein